MYKCYDCGYVFEEPKCYSEDRTPGGVFEGGSFIEHFTGCPQCAGAYDEAKECDGCGEWCFSKYLEATCNGDYCETCMEEIEVNEDEI